MANHRGPARSLRAVETSRVLGHPSGGPDGLGPCKCPWAASLLLLLFHQATGGKKGEQPRSRMGHGCRATRECHSCPWVPDLLHRLIRNTCMGSQPFQHLSQLFCLSTMSRTLAKHLAIVTAHLRDQRGSLMSPYMLRTLQHFGI